MISGEARAARVWRVVDEDGFGTIGDLAPQAVEVNLPAFIRQQIVRIKLNTQILADGLAKRESWLGNEDAVANFAHHAHCVVKSTRATKRQEHIIWINRVFRSAKLFGHGGSSRCSAGWLRIPIMLLRLNYLDDRLVYGCRQLKPICTWRLTKA